MHRTYPALCKLVCTLITSANPFAKSVNGSCKLSTLFPRRNSVMVSRAKRTNKSLISTSTPLPALSICSKRICRWFSNIERSDTLSLTNCGLTTRVCGQPACNENPTMLRVRTEAATVFPLHPVSGEDTVSKKRSP